MRGIRGSDLLWQLRGCPTVLAPPLGGVASPCLHQGYRTRGGERRYGVCTPFAPIEALPADPRGQRGPHRGHRPRGQRRRAPARRGRGQPAPVARPGRRHPRDRPRERDRPAAPVRSAGVDHRHDGARRALRSRRKPSAAVRRQRGGRAPAPGVRPHARPARARAPPGLRGCAARAGGRACAPRARPPRRGQPVADRRAAAPAGDRADAARALRAELRETPRPRRWPWTSCCAWRASCARPRWTTTGSRPPCARRSAGSPAQTGVEATLQIAPDLGELGPDEQIVVYRVVQEGLSNIAQHAGAANVEVELRRDGEQGAARDRRRLRVRRCRARHGGGMGITGMRERALLAGGRCAYARAPGTEPSWS